MIHHLGFLLSCWWLIFIIITEIESPRSILRGATKNWVEGTVTGTMISPNLTNRNIAYRACAAYKRLCIPISSLVSRTQVPLLSTTTLRFLRVLRKLSHLYQLIVHWPMHVQRSHIICAKRHDYHTHKTYPSPTIPPISSAPTRFRRRPFGPSKPYQGIPRYSGSSTRRSKLFLSHRWLPRIAFPWTGKNGLIMVGRVLLAWHCSIPYLASHLFASFWECTQKHPWLSRCHSPILGWASWHGFHLQPTYSGWRATHSVCPHFPNLWTGWSHRQSALLVIQAPKSTGREGR